MRGATLLGNDPRPQLPGRIVSHVLLMAALEVSHPVARRILMVADDPPGDGAHIAVGAPSKNSTTPVSNEYSAPTTINPRS